MKPTYKHFIGRAIPIFAAIVALETPLAMADGTETLGTPSIPIQSGTGIIAAGTGMFNQPGEISITVPTGATVKQVLLYWEGENANNSPADDTIVVNGTSITGTQIGGPTFFFNQDGTLPIYFTSFRADITALNLVNPGPNTLAVEGLANNFRNDGAGVLVIYDDGTTPSEIGLRDGQDLAFFQFAEPLKSTVPQTFTFAAAPTDRTSTMCMFFGSVADDRVRPTRITITLDVGGSTVNLDNVLNSTDGSQWDTLNVPVTISAGATTLTVLAISTDTDATPEDDGLGASFAWISTALSVPPPSGIGGTVFCDSNNDGTQQPGEQGIPGATVKLLTCGGTACVDTTIDFETPVLSTDYQAYPPGSSYSAGGFAFSSPTDLYIIKNPAGCGDGGCAANGSQTLVGLNGPIAVINSGGGTPFSIKSVDVSEGTTGTGFPNSTVITITGTPSGGGSPVSETHILDGTIGNFEPFVLSSGFANQAFDSIVISGDGDFSIDNLVLTTCTSGGPGTLVDTKTTDANGHYLFADIPPGCYQVEVELTTLPPGTALGRCPNNVTVNLAASQSFLDANFCFDCCNGAIGDFVWHDLNGNGCQDAGEPGIQGVRVDLYSGCDPSTATWVASTSTDPNGRYQFTGLCLGQYSVSFNTPAGFARTVANAGCAVGGQPADETDSDCDCTAGAACGICVTLTAAKPVDLSIDCGYVLVQNGCTRTIGYYKNHPSAIKPLPIYLGTPGGAKTLNVRTQQIGVDVLSQKVYGVPSNGITKLYAQLLAAKINILAGATPSAVSAVITQADAFLATRSYRDWGTLNRSQVRSVLAWHATLDKYNNGLIGPGHCGEEH